MYWLTFWANLKIFIFKYKLLLSLGQLYQTRFLQNWIHFEGCSFS